MIGLMPLIKDTVAYKTVYGDKERGTLSHAYLAVCADKTFIKEYVKILARLIVCKEKDPCGECRACRLTEAETHPDVYFYPRTGELVVAEDVTDLIEKTNLKPIESDKKVFVLTGGETMNASAQNKLLKTLEEPPAGVHIFIGSTSEYPLLPTVRSRTKKLEIPAFSADKIIAALKDECPDAERLKTAVSLGDGTLGNALALYGDENLAAVTDVCQKVLVGMRSSRDVLKYSAMITGLKSDLDEFLSVFELLLRDMLVYSEGKEPLVFDKRALATTKRAEGYNTASLLYALDKVTEAKKIKKANGGGAMLIERLLFSVLEGKHKWQKY